jgi:hypothetical protein
MAKAAIDLSPFTWRHLFRFAECLIVGNTVLCLLKEWFQNHFTPVNCRCDVTGTAPLLRAHDVKSPQSAMRWSKKVSIKLLAITEPVCFRNRRLKAVGFSTANLG